MEFCCTPVSAHLYALYKLHSHDFLLGLGREGVKRYARLANFENKE